MGEEGADFVNEDYVSKGRAKNRRRRTCVGSKHDVAFSYYLLCMGYQVFLSSSLASKGIHYAGIALRSLGQSKEKEKYQTKKGRTLKECDTHIIIITLRMKSP
jgi:hypothetical protein